MAEKIVFKYNDMASTAVKIRDIKQQYIDAANTYVSSTITAVEGWEGASKEKFVMLINDSVKTYIGVTIPEIVETLAKMLEENARQMQDADEQIAAAIPDKLQ